MSLWASPACGSLAKGVLRRVVQCSYILTWAVGSAGGRGAGAVRGADEARGAAAAAGGGVLSG